VALLVYCYAVGERSSRRIERRCMEDVATRLICANRAPDHTTIARFRQRHEAALGELFGDVLALCAEAGLVNVGLIAIDGTKVHADASQDANRPWCPRFESGSRHRKKPGKTGRFRCRTGNRRRHGLGWISP
jgi:transposase